MPVVTRTPASEPVFSISARSVAAPSPSRFCLPLFPPPSLPLLSCLAPAPPCFAPPSSPFWLCRPVVVPTPLVVCCGSPRRHPVHGSSPSPFFLSSSFLGLYIARCYVSATNRVLYRPAGGFFAKVPFTHSICSCFVRVSPAAYRTQSFGNSVQ